MKAKVEKIVVKLNEQTFEWTQDEAEAVWSCLNALFGVKSSAISMPYISPANPIITYSDANSRRC